MSQVDLFKRSFSGLHKVVNLSASAVLGSLILLCAFGSKLGDFVNAILMLLIMLGALVFIGALLMKLVYPRGDAFLALDGVNLMIYDDEVYAMSENDTLVLNTKNKGNVLEPVDNMYTWGAELHVNDKQAVYYIDNISVDIIREMLEQDKYKVAFKSTSIMSSPFLVFLGYVSIPF